MPRICFVGEAWGEQEALARYPFVGPAGHQLLTLLEDAGILNLTTQDKQNVSGYFNSSGVLAGHYMRSIWEAHQDEFRLFNVFDFRPENNDIDSLCCSQSDDRVPGYLPIRPGKYLRREYLPELVRLYTQLKTAVPNIVVALGNTAAWALLHNPHISKIRGTVSLGKTIPFKTLAIFHPAAILRQWDLRHVTVLDLQKARYESTFKELRRPERKVYYEPSLSDLDWFFNHHIVKAKYISPDIETVTRQISCIGFATDIQTSIIVPFIDNRKDNGSYWSTIEEEVLAWEWVRKVLATPTKKVMQNGLYDCNFLWRGYGISVNNFEEDCMLEHHALYPESEKSLGFMGSIYANEISWKMLGRGASKTIKRDDE